MNDFLTDEMLEQAFSEFFNDDPITCYCKACKNEVPAEPDATKGYCENCQGMMFLINPIIEANTL
jgi:Zn finger protein HypA/HybF involved in hydrogenase expression